MTTRGILVHSKRRSRALSRSFEQAGYEVTWTGSPESCRDAIAARAVDLVLHDIDSSPSRELVASTTDARLPYLALTNCTDKALELCRCPHTPNLIIADANRLVTDARGARSLGVTASELLATVDKLSSGHMFGAAAHLAPCPERPAGGASVATLNLDVRRIFGDALAGLHEPLRTRGVGTAQAAATVGSAEQLLTAVCRAVDTGAIDDAAIEVQVGCDANTLAFGVRFGGFTGARIRALVRLLLGESVWPDVSDTDELRALRAPLAACRSVVVNVVPEQATELIGLFDRRPPDAGPPARLLQVFTNHEVVAAAGVPTETVAISDSMRAELRQEAGQAAVMRPLRGLRTERMVVPTDSAVPLELAALAPTVRSVS